jgi:hypothetical protein
MQMFNGTHQMPVRAIRQSRRTRTPDAVIRTALDFHRLKFSKTHPLREADDLDDQLWVVATRMTMSTAGGTMQSTFNFSSKWDLMDFAVCFPVGQYLFASCDAVKMMSALTRVICMTVMVEMLFVCNIDVKFGNFM